MYDLSYSLNRDGLLIFCTYIISPCVLENYFFYFFSPIHHYCILLNLVYQEKIDHWVPFHKNSDCNSLEKVQEKFVKNFRGLRTTDYRDRLRELGILTLVDRRQYLDLVEVFKIIKGFNNVCRSD